MFHKLKSHFKNGILATEFPMNVMKEGFCAKL